MLRTLLQKSGITPLTLFIICFFACATSLMAALPPHFLGAAVNALLGNEIPQSAPKFSPILFMNNFLQWVLAGTDSSGLFPFLALYFASSLIFQVVRNLFTVYVYIQSDRFILSLRHGAFASVIKARSAELTRYGKGDVVHRLMNDTQQLDNLLGTPLYTLFSDMLDLVWVAIIVSMIEWRLTLLLFAAVPILGLVSRKAASLQRFYAKKLQHNEANSTGCIQRSLLGIDTIKSFQGEEKEIADLKELHDENFSFRKQSNIRLIFFFFQEGVLKTLGTVCVVSYVAFLASKNATFIGVIPIVLIYTKKFYSPLSNWTRYYQTIQRGIVSYRRIAKLINLPEEELYAAPPNPLSKILPLKIHGTIQLESGGRVAMDLEMKTANVVVVRGKSGVGKTLLVKSLLGLGPTFSGTVVIGSHSISNDFQELRNHVAFAAQDNHFIPGTLAENICYPAETVNLSRCQSIMRALRLSYTPTHPVVEYGRNLSLGEQRRVILGRALYADKPILMLDEIDANVDEKTRKAIYEAIKIERNSRIIFMITHMRDAELDISDHVRLEICTD